MYTPPPKAPWDKLDLQEYYLKPSIPPAQLERIEPIVDSLLVELRRRTNALPSDAESALIYELEMQPPVPIQTESGE